ncbi:TPA: YihY/virulence factor BrkB family protein [Streptococcus suis]|uniref:YihY/virulence factor BrkB family protein n=1 Tax=Streptococcus suis TaxID=1307 RepID=UPI001ABE5B14|nr:YihY/virulence factor BrkB family protein [Streptococcus suis]MBO4110046.1 YihY/virulence factor BrkB family protein [Streptococcus suis]HEM3613943.1 YihY/virulence factor BrkB family protein [Streptococcus suis]HEM3636379.1 YihY/virulence factor BrkB family protein [Streptococcus suis]HEM3642738.1 YihY/virulence factor BrkB family protein [Streptococcus suis]HEM3667956.1 YihY/virulence factor BrkB family protein [Streptococcus suis]
MKKTKIVEGLKTFCPTFFSFYRSADSDVTSVAVAYYLLISIFPILLTLANLLPYYPFDVDMILSVVAEFVPDKLYPSVSSFITSVLTKPSSSWLGISILTTLWTLSRSMTILQKAFNKAYGINEHRDFIIGHLIGIFLGIGLQVIILLSITLLTFGQAVFSYINKLVPIEDAWLKGLLSQTQLVGLMALFAALVMLYFFLPNVRIKKVRYVFPGTLFVLLTMTSIGKLFSIYVDNYANKLLDFRIVTAVVFLVFMLWFIFMAQVLIIGAMINATVQSMQVEEFHARDGDIVSILNRLKARFTAIDKE